MGNRAEQAEKQVDKSQDRAADGLEGARAEAYAVPPEGGIKWPYKLNAQEKEDAEDTLFAIDTALGPYDRKHYTQEDKELIYRIAKDIAYGRSSDIDKVFQELGETPEGREYLKKIVTGLNDVYSKAGLGDVQFEYPTQSDGRKLNQLTISMEVGGESVYVAFRPDEKPVGDRFSGSMDGADWTGMENPNKLLRRITKHSVKAHEMDHGEMLNRQEKEAQERQKRQEEYDRQMAQLRAEYGL
jgi:hypothetical protein